MKVANSFKDYSFEFNNAYKNDKGKLVVDAWCKCDRCTKGVYVSRVENGQLIPHPYAEGVCFKCGGSGIIRKTIRVYTDEEFEKMEKTREKADKRKTVAREAKMKAEFAEKEEKWLTENGFNTNHTTYVYFPADSYDVKEELKAAGFKFSPNLFWHIAEAPEKYTNECVQIMLDDVAEISAWGTGSFKLTAKTFVNEKIKAARPTELSTSKWVGEEGERLFEVPVVLKSIREMETRFGYTQLVEFLDKFGNKFNWWTTVTIYAEPGDKILLTGTVKKHDEYQNNKITVLTRCKIKTP